MYNVPIRRLKKLAPESSLGERGRGGSFYLLLIRSCFLYQFPSLHVLAIFAARANYYLYDGMGDEKNSRSPLSLSLPLFSDVRFPRLQIEKRNKAPSRHILRLLIGALSFKLLAEKRLENIARWSHIYTATAGAVKEERERGRGIYQSAQIDSWKSLAI